MATDTRASNVSTDTPNDGLHSVDEHTLAEDTSRETWWAVLHLGRERFRLTCATVKQMQSLKTAFADASDRLTDLHRESSAADDARDELIDLIKDSLTTDRMNGAPTTARPAWMNQLDADASQLHPLKRALELSKLLGTWYVVAVKPLNRVEESFTDATESYVWNSETGQISMTLAYNEGVSGTCTQFASRR